jgi:Rrf2 family protein
MLKLTKKADYGLIALRHLATAPNATASTREIADAYHLPVPLLAKVMQQLARAGIAQSVSGTKGGYRLARDAGRITALEVIRAIDGPVILTHCFTEHGACDQTDSCTVREPLRRVHEAILTLLEKFTILELTEPAKVTLTNIGLNPGAAAVHPEILQSRDREGAVRSKNQ